MLKGKRVMWPSKGVAVLEDFDVDQPKSNEILVKTVSSRMIATEVACFWALPNTPPVLPGYVFAWQADLGMKRDRFFPCPPQGGPVVGTVIAAGDKVSNVTVGDRVVPGGRGHTSHAVATEDKVEKIPDNVSFDEAVFMGYVSVGLVGVRRALIELGESVAVFGMGPIGLSALQLARLSGGRPVIGVDVVDNRLEIAKKVGADHVFNSSRVDVVKEIQAVTPDRGANIVIDATGHPAVPPTCFEAAARFGRVILLGSPRGVTESVDFYKAVHCRDLTVLGAHGSVRPQGVLVGSYRVESHKNLGFWTERDDNALLWKLLADGEINTKEYVSASLKLSYERVQEGYGIALKERDRYLSVILDWTSCK